MPSNAVEPNLSSLTASILTLGCKVNQFESAAIRTRMTEAGFIIVPPGNPADVTVINTCTVTHKADWEVRALARRAHRANPAVQTVLTGCLAQLRPDEMATLPNVALVIGQDQKGAIPELLENIAPGDEPQIFLTPPGSMGRISDLGYPVFDRTRAFFRIQDGCSAWCTYCTIPRARGPSRSLEKEFVLAGLREYARAGYAEVVLTGIHLGAWGWDLTPPGELTDLIGAVLDEKGGPRLRLSSIEPNEVTDRLAAMFHHSERLCPHMHLPLQSGSDRILAAMHRSYTAAQFKDLVHRLTADHPDFCLGVDILVGFPGEDQSAFEETRALVADLPVAYLHVFPYSRRPGTPAASRPDQVPAGEIKRRVAVMRAIGLTKRQGFLQRCIGEVRPTLIENSVDRSTGLARGVTDHYVTVLLVDRHPPANTIIPVRLIRELPNHRLLGRGI